MKIVIMIVITLACWTRHSLVYCKAQVLNGFYWIKPMLLCFVHSVIVPPHYCCCCCCWNISFSFEPFRKYVFTGLDCRIAACTLVTYTIFIDNIYFFFCRLKKRQLQCFDRHVFWVLYRVQYRLRKWIPFDVHFDRAQRETKSIDFNLQYFNRWAVKRMVIFPLVFFFWEAKYYLCLFN